MSKAILVKMIIAKIAILLFLLAIGVRNIETFQGDSGYPNKKYLFTPLLNPASPEEQLYNEGHIRTRNTIERCFGILKRRFPVLAYGCRLKMQTVQAIIVATAVLHNFMKGQIGEEDIPPLPEELEQHALDRLLPIAKYKKRL